MDYTKDMNLESATGYAMPFVTPQGGPEVLLPFGRQNNPKTGEEFDHKGVDFKCKNQELYAVASGIVSGIRSDRNTGFEITVTYGNYDVTYRPIMQARVNIGAAVKAGQTIALSGNYLHIGVKFKSEDVDPMEFLEMIYGNYLTYTPKAEDGKEQYASLNIDVNTKYDKDSKEVEQMASKYFIPYFADMIKGNYKVPDATTEALKGAFSRAKEERLLFESIPSLSNPLGLGGRSAGLASMVIELLIGDFLRYLAMQHHLFLSSWGEAEKKNILGGMM